MARKSIRLPAHIRPEHYKILIKTDLEGFTFEGEETIDLVIDQATDQIKLHSLELEIDSAELIHNDRQTWAGKISYEKDAETATCTFLKKLPQGKGQLKLTFKGILNDKMRGFYRSKYTHNGQDKYLAATQFEATDARRAFPCFDEPSHKASFEVSLMVPPDLTAISNTTQTNIWEHESGLKVVEFVPTPKMSTYLLAFLVGNFESIETKTKDGVLVRVFTTPGKLKQAQFALETAAKMISFYSEYFDIPYPLNSLDLIAVPDFESNAMENWGAVVFRETAILVDEQHTSLGNRQWTAMVIAHELAHMWFGNLVTMQWWTHLWLNEGFASYVECIAVNHFFPDWDIWTQFMNVDHNGALELDSLKNTHPIEVEVHHPSEISEIFDAVSYSKGSSILRMLAEYLGPQNFREGLRHYLKKHSFANAQTEDLWRALEQVSGKSVKKIMKNWTSQPGYPLISIDESGRNLKLTQSRFFSSPISRKQSKDRTEWCVPVNVLTKGSKDPTQYLMDKKFLKIEKPDKGEWIKFNSGETSFLRIDYPAKYLQLLEKPIKEKSLQVLDRLGIIRDCFALAQSGQLATPEVLKLALSYHDEDDYTIWAILSSGLHEIKRLLDKDSNLYSLFQNFGRKVFTKIAKEMSWDKKIGEKHTDTLLRSLVLFNMGSYGDKKTIEIARELFEKAVLGKNLDPDLRSIVYNLVAENGGEKNHQKLLKLYRETDLQEEKARILQALTFFRDKKLIQQTLEFSLSKEVRAQDSFRVFHFTWLNSQGRELVWEFTKKNWKIILDKFGSTGHILTRFVRPIEVFNTQDQAKKVEAFFKKNPTPSVVRTVAQVLEKINSNVEWIRRDKNKIKEFLKNA